MNDADKVDISVRLIGRPICSIMSQIWPSNAIYRVKSSVYIR
jgi:hypothetical protein